MSNINQHFNGQNPLAYLGVNSFEPTDFIPQPRDPTTKDFRNVFLGTWWLNTRTYDLWYLANLNNNIATWIRLFRASNLQTLTGDTGGAISGDSAKNINIFSGFAPLTVDGDQTTHTLTLNFSTLANQYVTDSGTAIPSAGVLNIVGGLNINTSGAGNTVTVKTPTLSEGVIYANSSGVYTSLSKGNNGQTLIASTAGVPAWANITSTGASVTITNGAHSIDLSASAPPTGISKLFSATKSATSTNVTGDGTQYFYICNTELFDIGANYNNATGIFTAPSDGDYLFMTSCSFTPQVNDISKPPWVDIGFLTSAAVTYTVVYSLAEGTQGGGVPPVQNGGSLMLAMTAGQTIKPFIIGYDAGGPKDWSVSGGANSITSFCGFRFNT